MGSVGSREVPSVDVAVLGMWMDKEGMPGSGAPAASLISGGTQNLLYEIERGDLRVAMRIPPSTAPQSRDEGILREWRILRALSATDVPHARGIRVCADKSVMGRPFYLMTFVDGWSPMGGKRWPEPFAFDASERRSLAFELVDGTARLSRVDWRAAGLHDLGRPDGFHERQVDRWTAVLERARGRELSGCAEAAAWLRSHKPLDFIPGIMHGDYQFANVMFENGAPARLAAIIDWEMGTG